MMVGERKRRLIALIVISGMLICSFMLYCRGHADKVNIAVAVECASWIEKNIYCKVAEHLYDFVMKYSYLDSENARTRRSNMLLSIKAALLDEENQRIKRSVNFLDSMKMDYISTRVLYISENNQGRYAVISAGAKDNIVVGSPVLNEHGLVGRVVNVTDKFARIILTGSVNFAISGVSEKSKTYCVVRGSKEGLTLSNIDGAGLLDGERILTVRGPKMINGIVIARVTLKNDAVLTEMMQDVSKADIVAVARFAEEVEY